MEPIDLEKYREAWKKDSYLQEKKLSEQEITQFVRSSSKNIKTQFRSALILDIILKSLLVLAVFFLLLTQIKSGIPMTLLLFQVILIGGMFIQFRALKKLSMVESGFQIVESLKTVIEFYHREYLKTMYVSASTSTMVFLVGSYFYLINKYGEVPAFDWDDYLVFGVGVLLSFGISFFSQKKFNQFKINQLEECLNDAGELAVNESYIRNYQTDRKMYLLIFGIVLILGLAFFLYLIFK
ncbi:hypothetical protein E4S40_04895 [Algoriphagus kandeliae]|uniref:Uncharacterized protein n=1 Tax=Algoriphagus kandeliae TaxID=2562278 RepID=A0A4Y9QV23_9BACT|nr:hypothetical protein [Algoriphagus kandeliae]TFV95558.1 hypothetical protein E4S40_04895 [Algoriphagus kandeliae]